MKIIIKTNLNKRYYITCQWFGIDNCITSQIWFVGTVGISTFMVVATYMISGIFFGF